MRATESDSSVSSVSGAHNDWFTCATPTPPVAPVTPNFGFLRLFESSKFLFQDQELKQQSDLIVHL
jgi:hypothetical protein